MKLKIVKPAEIDLIRNECGRFIKESQGMPLFKSLPRSYDDFKRIKVRKKRLTGDSQLSAIFEKVLGIDLYRRTMFASSIYPELGNNSDLDAFYVFPVDKYKFLYNDEVKNTSGNYGALLGTLLEEMTNEEANQVLGELLKFTSLKDDLAGGLRSGAEIVFFGIPRYYAIRTLMIPSYKRFYEEIS